MFNKNFTLVILAAILHGCSVIHDAKVEIAEAAAQAACSAEYEDGYYDGVEQLWDDTSQKCDAFHLYGGEEGSCYDAGFLDGYESFDPCDVAGQQGLIADDAAGAE